LKASSIYLLEAFFLRYTVVILTTNKSIRPETGLTKFCEIILDCLNELLE